MTQTELQSLLNMAIYEPEKMTGEQAMKLTPLIVKEASDAYKETGLTPFLLVRQRKELLAECEKQLSWLEHVKPQITAPNSVMLGFEQSIKYLSIAIARAEGGAA